MPVDAVTWTFYTYHLVIWLSDNKYCKWFPVSGKPVNITLWPFNVISNSLCCMYSVLFTVVLHRTLILPFYMKNSEQETITWRTFVFAKARGLSILNVQVFFNVGFKKGEELNKRWDIKEEPFIKEYILILLPSITF